MKRLGIIDFDTSHAAAFVSRVNHVGVAKEHWVDGARFVVGCPGKSIIFPERIATESKAVQKLELPFVDSPDEMLKHNLDAVFIESNCGSQHLERAKFFLKHKLPLFIDKPFTCSLGDAEAIFELAEKAQVPVMSSSALRYAPEIAKLVASRSGENANLSTIAFGPAPLNAKNPGLFHYGIHAVEMLFATMGSDCQSLTAHASEHGDAVTGTWPSGRFGILRTSRPKSDYALTTISNGKVTHQSINTRFIYRDLLKAVIGMLTSGKSPILESETLAIVRFIELAADSSHNHGMPRSFKN